MATSTKASTRSEQDGKYHCGCGRAFAHAAWFAKHALGCDGKPVPTRGRIERLAARNGRSLVPVRSQPRRAARADRAAPPATPAAAVGTIAAAATDKAIEITIAGLLAKRAQLDTAITALQALQL